jgi:hypothetical protein
MHCEACGRSLTERWLDALCPPCLRRARHQLARLLEQAQQPFGAHWTWPELLRQVGRRVPHGHRGGPDGETPG